MAPLALRQIGELTLVEHGENLGEEEVCGILRGHDIALLSHNTVKVPRGLAEDPGELKYVINLHGTLRGLLDEEIVKSPDILVSNWGVGNSHSIAESAVTLTLAVLKDLHKRIQAIEHGAWHLPDGSYGGQLRGLHVGVYGAGHIGRRYIELIMVFEPKIKVFDPYVETIPEGCTRVDSLEELFDDIELIAIHAGLAEETRGSVSKALLAKLPKYGVVINTARGGIIDQAALFEELEDGRLRAGLDVLEPDYLEVGHPARNYDNLILTAHTLGRGWPNEGRAPRKLAFIDEIFINNIQKFIDGVQIDKEFIMDIDRFNIST